MFLTLKIFANSSCADEHWIFWTQRDSYLGYNSIITLKPLAEFHLDSTWPGLICVWNLNVVYQHDGIILPTFFMHLAGHIK